MVTIPLILLILAFLCAALALFVQTEKVNLTALGLLLAVIAILIGNNG